MRQGFFQKRHLRLRPGADPDTTVQGRNTRHADENAVVGHQPVNDRAGKDGILAAIDRHEICG